MSSTTIVPAAVVDRMYQDFIQEHGSAFANPNHPVIWIFFRPRGVPDVKEEFSVSLYRCMMRGREFRFALPLPLGCLEFDIQGLVKSYFRDGFEIQSVQRP